MDKIGLRQLFERFTEYMVVFEQLKCKHSLQTYKDLANISRDLDAAVVKEFQTTTELAGQLTRRLERHKTDSIVGITKSIENMLDRISARVAGCKRIDRLAEYFNLLVNYCIPKRYSEQKEVYLEELRKIEYDGDAVLEAYPEAA